MYMKACVAGCRVWCNMKVVTPPVQGSGRRVGGLILGGVPREKKMLEGHLPRVIYHQVY